MKLPVRIGLLFIFLRALVIQSVNADPPFFGTIFIDPDIITASDPTTFQGVSYGGQGLRTMFDRRVNAFIVLNAYLFNASFNDGLAAEIEVNPEFGSSSAALDVAQKYGMVIGRLPTALRADVQTVWIHQGTQPFGGGNNNLLIHTGQSALYEADGILEETLVHEASHTSLDADHASAPGWLAAQAADGEFISNYARDNPGREDIAESFLPYLAVRYRADRISQSLSDTVAQTIPHRITYFNAQSFDMYPIVLDLEGDYNRNGEVDAADYVMWRNSPSSFGGDPGGYNTWRAHFGQTAGSGVGDSANAPVPEPTTLVTLILAAAGRSFRRRWAA